MHLPIGEAPEYEPPSDLETVVANEIKMALSYSFLYREFTLHQPLSEDIYFHQTNSIEHGAALKLRDAVLRLRRDGAFAAVPLFRVNEGPVGPHPVGSYEIWCPAESFGSVYSYLTLNRGTLSVLIHPLTREQRRDHSERVSWLGPSYVVDLSRLPVLSKDIPFQYESLGLGYNARETITLEERRERGKKLEKALEKEPEAAKAPLD